MTVGELIQNLLRFNPGDHVVVGMPGYPVEVDDIDRGYLYVDDFSGSGHGELNLTSDAEDVIGGAVELPYESVVVIWPGRESADGSGVG